MLVSILLVVISGLLFLNAWQAWCHERAMDRERSRWSAIFAEAPELPPLRFSDLPPPPVHHMPFLLERRPDRLVATRRMHPPFENHGVEVSFAPTVGVS